MRPDIETFRKAVVKYRGNLSRVADAFGVTRTCVGQWVREHPDYKSVVADARMKLFDDCLVAGEVLALGQPMRDENGKVVGWERLPDANMLKYYLGILGRGEGFGDPAQEGGSSVTDDDEISKVNINIVYNDKKDLELQTRTDKEEETSEGE